MIESTIEWSDRMVEIEEHKRYVKVSWTDDGVTLVCEREECMETKAGFGSCWWEREYDGIPYPEDLVIMRDMHVFGGI
jgi:hypothetical protein